MNFNPSNIGINNVPIPKRPIFFTQWGILSGYCYAFSVLQREMSNEEYAYVISLGTRLYVALHSDKKEAETWASQYSEQAHDLALECIETVIGNKQ